MAAPVVDVDLLRLVMLARRRRMARAARLRARTAALVVPPPLAWPVP